MLLFAGETEHVAFCSLPLSISLCRVCSCVLHVSLSMSDVDRRRCPWRTDFWAHVFNFDLLSDFLDLRRHSVSLRAVRGNDIVERKPGLSTREIALTYQSGAMQRFMAFNSDAEWRRAVLKAAPLKMDFGAVYRDCVSKIQERKDTLSAVKVFRLLLFASLTFFSFPDFLLV